jgi:hypothetical protein
LSHHITFYFALQRSDVTVTGETDRNAMEDSPPRRRSGYDYNYPMSDRGVSKIARLVSNPSERTLGSPGRHTVFTDDLLSVCRIYLDLADIAISPFHDAVIHDSPKDRRDQCHEEHTWVAGRQFRQALEVSERLVAARRVGVMI